MSVCCDARPMSCLSQHWGADLCVYMSVCIYVCMHSLMSHTINIYVLKWVYMYALRCLVRHNNTAAMQCVTHEMHITATSIGVLTCVYTYVHVCMCLCVCVCTFMSHTINAYIHRWVYMYALRCRVRCDNIPIHAFTFTLIYFKQAKPT